MSNQADDYRKMLIETGHKFGESFDKAIMALSGGALGISIAFIKSVIGKGPLKSQEDLLIAWILLTTSLASVLLSLYLGILSYRHAIKQVDQNTIHQQKPGGIFAIGMSLLNFISALSFVAGLVFLIFFAFNNLGG